MAHLDATTTSSSHSRRDAHRRRRRLAAIIVAAVVVVLLVVAYFVAEAVARGIVENDIRTRISTALALPADADVAVTVEGAIIPQLIGGSLDDVTVTSDAVPLGSTTADVVFSASGVPVRGDAGLSSADAEVTLSAAGVAALLADDTKVSDVTLAAPDVTATVSVPVEGRTVAAVVSLLPSAANGDLVLTPQSYEVDGATLSDAEVKADLGASADDLVAARTVCVKKDVPTGLTLSDVAVQGDTVVARFDVAGGILDDPSLQKKGTCG